MTHTLQKNGFTAEIKLLLSTAEPPYTIYTIVEDAAVNVTEGRHLQQ